ncbi:MAG: hypothetical protein MZV63_68135 [Marinilabiliales bacterium]|nr:hypothetical protein [Marinilabiliales bacterium]
MKKIKYLLLMITVMIVTTGIINAQEVKLKADTASVNHAATEAAGSGTVTVTAEQDQAQGSDADVRTRPRNQAQVR